VDGEEALSEGWVDRTSSISRPLGGREAREVSYGFAVDRGVRGVKIAQRGERFSQSSVRRVDFSPEGISCTAFSVHRSLVIWGRAGYLHPSWQPAI
jgi:hypothetical protein